MNHYFLINSGQFQISGQAQAFEKKFTAHFLKSPKQTGIVSISAFGKTFSAFRDTDSLRASTVVVAE